jgi:hypothetical protein
MTVFWIIGVTALAVIWGITIVDLFRRHYSGAATVGWLALIVLLPFIGALAYWVLRKPSRDEVEQQYLGEAELRRSTAARPFDSTGL